MTRSFLSTERDEYENTTLSSEITLYEENPTQADYLTLMIVNYAYLCYSPLLVILGIVGNLMSVYVFFNSKLRQHPTSQYLSALAISDTVFLLQLIPPWLSVTHDIKLFYTGGYCQFFVYISYVSSSSSSWLVVVFTIERAVVVTRPLCRTLCTLRRSRYIIVGLGTTSAIVNLPVLQLASPTDAYECGIDRKYLYFATRFNIVDSTVSFTIPMCAIIFINAWITYSIFRLDKERLEMLREESEQNQVQPQLRHRGPRPIVQSYPRYPRGQQRITKMLLIVSSTHVLLNLPAYGIRFAAYGYRENAVDIAGKWVVLQQVAALCFHTNFGINFFLYCLNGRNFREALIESIPLLRRYAIRAARARRRTNVARATSNSISTSIGSNGIELDDVITVQPPPRYEPDVIYRWKFNNKRQQPAQQNQCGPFCQRNQQCQRSQLYAGSELCQRNQFCQFCQPGRPGPSRSNNIEIEDFCLVRFNPDLRDADKDSKENKYG